MRAQLHNNNIISELLRQEITSHFKNKGIPISIKILTTVTTFEAWQRMLQMPFSATYLPNTPCMQE